MNVDRHTLDEQYVCSVLRHPDKGKCEVVPVLK
jgi:hypothetical protein